MRRIANKLVFICRRVFVGVIGKHNIDEDTLVFTYNIDTYDIMEYVLREDNEGKAQKFAEFLPGFLEAYWDDAERMALEAFDY